MYTSAVFTEGTVSQELIAEEAANRKDIEDVIEEERAKVDAKTPITQNVFLKWRQKNRDDKVQAQEAAEVERKKKGVMTGREIFAQVKFSHLRSMSSFDSSEAFETMWWLSAFKLIGWFIVEIWNWQNYFAYSFKRLDSDESAVCKVAF